MPSCITCPSPVGEVEAEAGLTGNESAVFEPESEFKCGDTEAMGAAGEFGDGEAVTGAMSTRSAAAFDGTKNDDEGALAGADEEVVEEEEEEDATEEEWTATDAKEEEEEEKLEVEEAEVRAEEDATKEDDKSTGAVARSEPSDDGGGAAAAAVIEENCCTVDGTDGEGDGRDPLTAGSASPAPDDGTEYAALRVSCDGALEAGASMEAGTSVGGEGAAAAWTSSACSGSLMLRWTGGGLVRPTSTSAETGANEEPGGGGGGGGAGRRPERFALVWPFF